MFYTFGPPPFVGCPLRNTEGEDEDRNVKRNTPEEVVFKIFNVTSVETKGLFNQSVNWTT